MAGASGARWRLRAVLPCWVALLVSAATAVPVGAATITVDSFNQVDPGKCTIAVAIASMNAAADQAGCTHAGAYGTNDTIVLAAGTYALTTADNGMNAYPVIHVPVTVNGNGATLSRTVGNMAPFFRFFEVQAGGLTLHDVTLTGGNVPSGDGGAIMSGSGPLTITGATFSGNRAVGGDGGAIYHASIEAASISDTTFTNNTVSPNGDGGAIYDSSTNGMTLVNTTFSGNSASGGDGGAILDSSTGGLTIMNGTFAGNSAAAGDGGAIYDSSTGGLEFHGGSVTGNSVSPGGDGGGIYDISTGGLRVTNVLFSDNTATGGDGGAIYDNSSVATGPVSDNCIFGNTATIGGGGILRVSSPDLNAIDNWWGAATGPSEAGPGTGDAVSSNVTFAPFLTSPAAVCSPSTTTTSTTTTTLVGAETCGDCVDNDGNGLADFEDPACCPAGNTLALKIRKARLLPRKKGGTLLGLDTTIRQGASAGLDPLTQDVFLQIREQGGNELLCARMPASRFAKRHGKLFKFLDRKLTEKEAEGVTGTDLRRAKRDVILHAEGRKANVATPTGTTLVVTVGFRNPAGAEADNRCAGTVKTFRKSGKRGGLRVR
jgi:predicted outer membrane repeat protein